MDSNEKYELLLTQLRAKEGFICDMDGVIYTEITYCPE